MADPAPERAHHLLPASVRKGMPMGSNSPKFPQDITHAIARLFEGNRRSVVNATAEAKRLLRMFPDCSLTVEEMSELIAQESVNHSGSGVMLSREG